MTGGLKNRGKTKADVEERRRAVEGRSGVQLQHVSSFSFDPVLAGGNVENMIGVTQVPLGFVGPVQVNGEHAKGEFIVPMATTEGALIASVNRGCSALTAAGGANALIVRDEMTRAPVFRVDDIRHGLKVAEWVEGHMDEIRSTAEATTRHGKLLKIDPFLSGRSLFLRFRYDTGDAMGMNMATIATEAAAKLIEARTGAVLISISGNLCTDKKPAAIDYLLGRGKLALADARIPRTVVEEKLRTTPERAAEACYRKNQIGSALALSYGQNAHVANVLSAIFIATGQDPAQVAEGSMGMTACEVVDGELYISVRLPALELGTIGGGTKLPCQTEALAVMGCLGAGNAKKMAEVVASVVLGGELGTIAAQAAGELTKAHQALGR